MQQHSKATKCLYDTDFNLWVEETLKQLQTRNYEALDWENLIEEVALPTLWGKMFVYVTLLSRSLDRVQALHPYR